MAVRARSSKSTRAVYRSAAAFPCRSPPTPAGRSDRLVEVLLGLADTAASVEVAVHALAAADRLRDRDKLRLPPPVADRLRTVGDRWSAAVGEPAYSSTDNDR